MIHRPTLSSVLLSLSRDADIWRKEEREREKRGNWGEVEKEGGGSDGEVIRPIPAGAPASVQGWLGRGPYTLDVLTVLRPPGRLQQFISTIACLRGTPQAMQTS